MRSLLLFAFIASCVLAVYPIPVPGGRTICQDHHRSPNSDNSEALLVPAPASHKRPADASVENEPQTTKKTKTSDIIPATIIFTDKSGTIISGPEMDSSQQNSVTREISYATGIDLSKGQQIRPDQDPNLLSLEENTTHGRDY
ncbi:hypothetical protein BDP27DRAFT_1358839 [Rhodocollybia butyracea]|uniref:Secreted protein n=1 Tax=Rhodocollybia butyracea TaxID=206335 RepID=A0A9P5UDE1_9AGAR|nr:hypothetical protein BDP27DRAFT_1358839 [Rhodocollybia butyracea]